MQQTWKVQLYTYEHQMAYKECRKTDLESGSRRDSLFLFIRLLDFKCIDPVDYLVFDVYFLGFNLVAQLYTCVMFV